MNPTDLDPYLMKQVEMGMDGADILHGHLKILMLTAESDLAEASEQEQRSEEAMDSMVRTECEGRLDALAEVYSLTYAIAFAKEEVKSRKEILGE